MDTLEKIKTEYMLMEPVMFPNADNVYDLLEQYHYDMHDSMRTSRKSIRQNNFDNKVERIKRNLYEFFGLQVTSDLFDDDNEILNRHYNLAESFDKYFVRMCDCLDDDNFSDISTLAQFAHKKYLDNYSYLESLRDGIRFSVEGITYYGQGEDDSSEFGKFFEEEFNNIISKGNEKVKKPENL